MCRHSTVGVDRAAISNIPFQHFNISTFAMGLNIHSSHLYKSCICSVSVSDFDWYLFRFKQNMPHIRGNAAFEGKIITIPFEPVHIGNMLNGEKNNSRWDGKCNTCSPTSHQFIFHKFVSVFVVDVFGFLRVNEFRIG